MLLYRLPSKISKAFHSLKTRFLQPARQLCLRICTLPMRLQHAPEKLGTLLLLLLHEYRQLMGDDRASWFQSLYQI